MACGSGGVDAADQYQRAFHERFEAIAASPLRYPAVDHIREGYRRSVLGSDSIYFRIGGLPVWSVSDLARPRSLTTRNSLTDGSWGCRNRGRDLLATFQ